MLLFKGLFHFHINCTLENPGNLFFFFHVSPPCSEGAVMFFLNEQRKTQEENIEKEMWLFFFFFSVPWRHARTENKKRDTFTSPTVRAGPNHHVHCAKKKKQKKKNLIVLSKCNSAILLRRPLPSHASCWHWLSWRAHGNETKSGFHFGFLALMIMGKKRKMWRLDKEIFLRLLVQLCNRD